MVIASVVGLNAIKQKEKNNMLNEQNRNEFLQTIAEKLGRPIAHKPQPQPTPVNNLAKTRLTNLTQDELCKEFTDFAQTQMVKCVVSKPEELINSLIDLCESYDCKGSVVISGDDRLDALGVTKAISKKYETYIWNPELGHENIIHAERSQIGIVFAEAGLTESGGIVLFSSPEKGRAVSLLPETSIVILRKSDILPRVAQIAERLHKMAQEGVRMPSCINLIGGASSTADIELIKVWGVHGPVHAAYLIIEDC